MIGNPENPYPLAAPPKLGEIVHLPTGSLVTEEQMIAVAADARVVYVGETHDNPASHRLQLQMLRGLSDRHPGRQALAMEMFVPSQQLALDRWVAGELDEKGFLRESKWFDNWRMDFGYYRDILLLARERHIPVIALNAEKDLVRGVRDKELKELHPEEQAKLPEIDPDDPYQKALVTAVFGDHVRKGMNLDGFIRAQTLRDEAMADKVAGFLKSDAGRQMNLLVLAGGDHVRYGFGIPRRAFRRLPVSYVIIGGSEIDADKKQDRLMNVTFPTFPMVPYDFEMFVSYEDLPQTGVKLGVMMEGAKGGGVVVKGVVPGSSADKGGILKEDVIVSLDGEKITDSLDLVYALKGKKSGDKGKVEVKRGEALKEIEVTYSTDPGKGHGEKK